MKILQINKFFDLRGGAEVYMHSLISHLEKNGHELHAFATRSDKNLPSKDKSYFIKRNHYDKLEGPLTDIAKAKSFIWNSEASRSLEHQINEVKPDVIHLHNVYHHLSSSILAVILKHKIPCVQTLHDYKLACPNYKMFTQGSVCERCKGGKYYNAVLHQCLFSGYLPNILGAVEMSLTKLQQSYEKTVHAFICPSLFMKNKMQEWGEPPSKLTYIPNPTEIPMEVSGNRSSGPYVFIGRLYPEKGIEVLIRAVARISNIRLSIIGEGPEKFRLQSLANKIAPNRIHFLGFQSGEALKSLRQSARALCVPSIWYENAPLTVLEAMSEGIPVIASDIGGIPEMIQDGVTGFLALPNNIESWIDAINQMEAFSKNQRLDMGDSAREVARQKFSWESHMRQIEKLYEAVQ
ncbi:MAG: glycosyltransferase [Patescibacteria group bacterium]